LSALAEDFRDSPTIKLLCSIAEKRKLHFVAGIAEKEGEHFYNSAVLITPERGLTAIYRKVHLFNEEKFFFQAGNIPFQVHQTTLAKIGMLVCFDWAFPEAARVLALKGAQVLCHPANLVLPYCQKTMIGRCIENRVFAVTANRTGSDVKGERILEFKGQSQIVDTKGNVLAASDQTREEIKTVCLNPEDADNKNITPHNHLLNDRRVDFYKDLAATLLDNEVNQE
jgi:predicted amidohydrolase